jgi:hypothetical protein
VGWDICVPFAMLQGPSVSCSNESQQWQQNCPASANPQPQPLTAPQPSGEWLPTAPESPADAVEASLDHVLIWHRVGQRCCHLIPLLQLGTSSTTTSSHRAIFECRGFPS